MEGWYCAVTDYIADDGLTANKHVTWEWLDTFSWNLVGCTTRGYSKLIIVNLLQSANCDGCSNFWCERMIICDHFPWFLVTDDITAYAESTVILWTKYQWPCELLDTKSIRYGVKNTSANSVYSAQNTLNLFYSCINVITKRYFIFCYHLSIQFFSSYLLKEFFWK